MKARALTGDQSRPLVSGEGRVGDVWLKVTVAPDVKTRLVNHAETHGRTFSDEVRRALEVYLDEMGA